MCKKGDCWLTRHTKEERNEVREGFKRRVYQYLADNNIDDDSVPTSGNFFYNDHGIKHFMTLNGPILIKTAKNIVTSMNNDAFAYSLIGIEPGGTEPSIVRRDSIGNKSSNDKGKSATYLYDDKDPPDLTINIDFLDCYFDDNG